MLVNLLTLNPYFRWTASECLAHPMFDDVRNEDNERNYKTKIKLDVDQDDAFDYEQGKSEKFTTEDLFESLIQEVDDIH